MTAKYNFYNFKHILKRDVLFKFLYLIPWRFYLTASVDSYLLARLIAVFKRHFCLLNEEGDILDITIVRDVQETEVTKERVSSLLEKLRNKNKD